MKLIVRMPPKKAQGIKHYNKLKNNICILRLCGGYGDILMSRMIFEDLKKQYPDFKITYALPQAYFQVIKDHKYIDEVIDHKDIDYNNYRQVFNITHHCSRHEAFYNKECVKNRSDIWAESFGLTLDNHNMHLPSLEKNRDYIFSLFKQGGYKEGQKIIAFTPYSAVPTRHIMQKHRELVEKRLLETDAFCFYMHNIPTLDQLKFPLIACRNFIEAMSMIYFSDMVISTDTGHLHCAGGYNKPLLGFFNYTNGHVVGKHYKNLTVIQKDSSNDKNWTCGPCNNMGRCPYPLIDKQLKCSIELPMDIVNDKLNYFLNKFCV